ncbi:MAG: response regulator [Deltaproteobacteria bacterium]|nr:response regulator [Deltaproteobacteria bacterium]MBW2643785.1 response regulator [Deltaproteobacteria bacterium]
MAANILIIETNNFLCEHLFWHMDKKDWRIFKSRQQKDVTQILKIHKIDVVLLDLSDLKKEGLALLKMIKKMRPAIQVITINSGEQISLSIEGMKLGAFDDFLMPLNVDSLICRIREAYQKKKGEKKNKGAKDERNEVIAGGR